ncbi:MAG: RNA-guided endonuclease InsQ/TnpB family protein [Blastocatellia bacterium]
MRTVKRVSVKLNKDKYERIEGIARAFAEDKQAHLDFYQEGLAFSEARNWRVRRDALKTTDYHGSTPLPVHLSDLAVKDAFEAEEKYWASIAAEIRPRIGSREWTDEQKHYAFWLLYDPHRFSSLIPGKAPVNEKISLSVPQRKQVQNYLRRRARRMMGERPRVRIVRSFVLDNTLYSVSQTLSSQILSIASLEKGERIAIPLKGEGEIKGNIRLVLMAETRSVEVHVSFDVDVPANTSNGVVAVDVGLTEVFVDDEGDHYGEEIGEIGKKDARQLNVKGKKRNKLGALREKYMSQGKKKKARHIKRYNLGTKKKQELKRRTKMSLENQINRAINEILKKRQPTIIVTEKLDFRGKAQSKEMSRRVNQWRRSTLKERVEFKASAAGCRREQVNPAYTSQMCPQCGYLDKANRKGEAFQCLNCEHAGDADHIGAQNLKSRYFDSRITLYTPKETVREILLKDYNARLERQNASTEKTRMATVPGQTLERDKVPVTRWSRQSKSKTAADKSTKSAAIK